MFFVSLFVCFFPAAATDLLYFICLASVLNLVSSLLLRNEFVNVCLSVCLFDCLPISPSFGRFFARIVQGVICVLSEFMRNPNQQFVAQKLR